MRPASWCVLLRQVFRKTARSLLVMIPRLWLCLLRNCARADEKLNSTGNRLIGRALTGDGGAVRICPSKRFIPRGDWTLPVPSRISRSWRLGRDHSMQRLEIGRLRHAHGFHAADRVVALT